MAWCPSVHPRSIAVSRMQRATAHDSPPMCKTKRYLTRPPCRTLHAICGGFQKISANVCHAKRSRKKLHATYAGSESILGYLWRFSLRRSIVCVVALASRVCGQAVDSRRCAASETRGMKRDASSQKLNARSVIALAAALLSSRKSERQVFDAFGAIGDVFRRGECTPSRTLLVCIRPNAPCRYFLP